MTSCRCSDAGGPRPWRLAWIGVVAVIAMYAVSGFRVIPPEEVAVVYRLGRITVDAAGGPRIHPPGLLMALPSPIDEVVRVPVLREESLTLAGVSGSSGGKPERPWLTGDLALVDTAMTVKYRITDPVQFVTGVQNPREVLGRFASAAVVAVMGQCSLDEVLRLRVDAPLPADAPRALTELIRRHIHARLSATECGIEVTGVEIQTVAPPSPVRSAFDAFQTARIDQEAAQERARGLAFERRIEAASLAQQTVAEAHGGRLARLAEATEQVALFQADLEQFERDAGATRQRLRRESLQAVIEHCRRVLSVPMVTAGNPIVVRVPASEAGP